MHHSHPLGALLALLAFATSAPAESPESLTTRFTLTASVRSPQNANRLQLWVPIPTNNAFQTIESIHVSAPVEHRITREPRYGNRMVYLAVDEPPASVDIRVEYVVTRRQPGPVAAKPGAPAAGRLALYLAPRRLIPVGGRYKALADSIARTGEPARTTIRRMFDHILATMGYDYQHESPRLGQGDVAFVCDYRKGNCSDIHSYLMSLARSEGIPIYMEYGFPVSGVPPADPLPVAGEIGGYHCWTWFFDETRGWIPVDASDALKWRDQGHPHMAVRLFGSLLVARSAVAVSVGRDIQLTPRQTGPALNYFVYPYAEIDGKSAPVKWKLNYRLE